MATDTQAPASAALSTDPLLTLSTLVVRKVIEIDGRRYEVRNIAELSPLEMARYTHQFTQLDELQDKGHQATDADVQEVHRLVGAVIAEAVIGLEPAVFEKLHTLQRMAIANVFIGRSAIGSSTASAPVPTTATAATGAKSPRASLGSTPARRRPAGSRRRSR